MPATDHLAACPLSQPCPMTGDGSHRKENVPVGRAYCPCRCICEPLRTFGQRIKEAQTSIAFRPDGKRAGELETIGGREMPDGTRSASFCCGCEENTEAVLKVIDAIDRVLEGKDT